VEKRESQMETQNSHAARSQVALSSTTITLKVRGLVEGATNGTWVKPEVGRVTVTNLFYRGDVKESCNLQEEIFPL